MMNRNRAKFQMEGQLALAKRRSKSPTLVSKKSVKSKKKK